MIDFAMEALCAKLYKRTKWESAYWYAIKIWQNAEGQNMMEEAKVYPLPEIEREHFGYMLTKTVPAYSLSHLYRLLESTANREWSNGWLGSRFELFWDEIDKDWSIHFKNTDMDDELWFKDEQTYGHVRFQMPPEKTPEDALCALAIKLVNKKIVLKPKEKKS